MSEAAQNKEVLNDAALNEACKLTPSAAQAIREMLGYQKVMGSPTAYYCYPFNNRDKHRLSARGIIATQGTKKRPRYRLTRYGREVAGKVEELNCGETGDPGSEKKHASA